eukprot:1493136-Amphidinium_carterae.1
MNFLWGKDVGSNSGIWGLFWPRFGLSQYYILHPPQRTACVVCNYYFRCLTIPVTTADERTAGKEKLWGWRIDWQTTHSS